MALGGIHPGQFASPLPGKNSKSEHTATHSHAYGQLELSVKLGIINK